MLELILSAIIALTSATAATSNTIDEFKKVENTIISRYDNTEFINAEHLTYEILDNRATTHTTIVEIVSGTVVNARTGAGITSDNYYISYKSIAGIQDGSSVITYLIYNPNNNHEDDIIDRFDIVLD